VLTSPLPAGSAHESQNHRMFGVARGLCGSRSPENGAHTSRQPHCSSDRSMCRICMKQIPAHASNRYRQLVPVWSMGTRSISGRGAGRELPGAGPGAHRPVPSCSSKATRHQGWVPPCLP